MGRIFFLFRLAIFPCWVVPVPCPGRGEDGWAVPGGTAGPGRRCSSGAPGKQQPQIPQEPGTAPGSGERSLGYPSTANEEEALRIYPAVSRVTSVQRAVSDSVSPGLGFNIRSCSWRNGFLAAPFSPQRCRRCWCHTAQLGASFSAPRMCSSIHSFLQSVLSSAHWAMKSTRLKLVVLCWFWIHRTQRVLRRVFRIKREH